MRIRMPVVQVAHMRMVKAALAFKTYRAPTAEPEPGSSGARWAKVAAVVKAGGVSSGEGGGEGSGGAAATGM